MNKCRIKANVNNKVYYVKNVQVDKQHHLFTVITWTPNPDDAFLYPKDVAETTVRILSESGHYYDFDMT